MRAFLDESFQRPHRVHGLMRGSGREGGVPGPVTAEPVLRPLEFAGRLYAAYQDGMFRRRLALDDLNGERKRRREKLARDWARRRREIEYMALTKRDSWDLLKQTRRFEAEARRRLAAEMDARRREAVERVPCANWSGFLRWRARQGDETALAVLRSRGEEVSRETIQSPESPAAAVEAWRQIQQDGRTRDQHIRAVQQIQKSEKGALLAMSRMQRLAALERARGRPGEPRLFQNAAHDIDARGVVLFTLGDGGRIADAGYQVFFNARNERAAQAAEKYARVKWGPAAVLEGCGFRRGFVKEPARESRQKDRES